MAPHSSTLAWKIPWMEEPGRLQSMGSLGVGHDWATSLSLFTFMHWRRKWQPTPVFLPGESQGAWWAAVYGVAQSRTRLRRLSSSSSSSALLRGWTSSRAGCQLSSMKATAQFLAQMILNALVELQYLKQNPVASSYCCSVAGSYLTLCDPMGCIVPGCPVLHCLPEFAKIHVHRAADAI